MPTGRVKWFDSKKGYGFIKVEDSEKDVFLHVSALEKSKLRVLKENQKIQFEIQFKRHNITTSSLQELQLDASIR